MGKYAIIFFSVLIIFTGASCSTTQTNDEMLRETAELFSVNNFDGSGVATRSFIGGEFNHIVTAELDDPTDGSFYEGWLIREPKAGDFFSTGKMEKVGSEYFLEYMSGKNYPDHNTVVITLEQNDDGEPEEHILEGTF